MRILEVRRHSHRNTPLPHLSQLGVELARRAGSGLGTFDRVVTSTMPRAFETAIAMGYAVNEQIEQLSLMSDEVTAIIQWNAGFAAWARAVQQSPVVTRYTQALAWLWRSIVRALPDGGRALIITHGGIIEAGTVGLILADMPITDAAACGYCEGVRLTFEGDAVINLEMLRVDQPR
jgi:broad specificity phosphatase PhoE